MNSTIVVFSTPGYPGYRLPTARSAREYARYSLLKILSVPGNPGKRYPRKLSTVAQPDYKVSKVPGTAGNRGYSSHELPGMEVLTPLTEQFGYAMNRSSKSVSIEEHLGSLRSEVPGCEPEVLRICKCRGYQASDCPKYPAFRRPHTSFGVWLI